MTLKNARANIDEEKVDLLISILQNHGFKTLYDFVKHDKSIDNIGFWKRKAGIFREKAGFIGNIMQRACTISDKYKGFYC